MLDNVNWHAIVAYAHYRRPRALQLYHILPVLVYLSLVYLPNLILIALAKQLAYCNLTNANSCMSIVKRVQRYPKLLACLSP